MGSFVNASVSLYVAPWKDMDLLAPLGVEDDLCRTGTEPRHGCSSAGFESGRHTLSTWVRAGKVAGRKRKLSPEES